VKGLRRSASGASTRGRRPNAMQSSRGIREHKYQKKNGENGKMKNLMKQKKERKENRDFQKVT
jgi:hypothetical protein